MDTEKKTKSLAALLRENGVKGRLPMHMPGHKRNADCAPYLEKLSLREDITEIDGFDNLHGAEGILADSMARAASLWGADRSYFLVNGASGGILAGIRALTRRGDTVLMTRAAHKSVYHAVELCGLKPIFLLPPIADAGFFGSIPPSEVAEALRVHPEVKLVILTSPTYEGVISDIAAVAEIAHNAGVPLLVDEAHGAHLDLSAHFSGGAVKAGADLVVQSVHKTLPSLTQTAILHVCGSRVDADRLAHQLSVFETSSPSYLLLASIDGCVRAIAENGALLADWAEALSHFDSLTHGLRHLQIPYHGADAEGSDAAVFAYDRSKIYVSARGTSADGATLAAALRARGIEPEMVTADGVLCMTGAGDTKDSLTALADALCAIDAEIHAESASEILPGVPAPPLVLDSEDALASAWESVPLTEALGRTAAEYVWAYPPGIPLLIPGEEITEACVRYIRAAGEKIRLYGTRGALPERIAVVKNGT